MDPATKNNNNNKLTHQNGKWCYNKYLDDKKSRSKTIWE